MTDLGTLGGPNSFGEGINASGQVTGYSHTTQSLIQHAFLYSNGTMTDLGTLGGTNSYGYGINANGQVTGASEISPSLGGLPHAFLYTAGTMIDINPLGVPGSGGTAINASGQVTGYLLMPRPEQQAFLYSAGSAISLGTLGGPNSVGRGISGGGQVVGASSEASGRVRAFLYSEGKMINLNALVLSGLNGATLEDARGINDSGQIVALGCVMTDCQAYRLDPVAGPLALPPIPTLSREALGAMALLVLASGLLIRRW
jgi:probable HAF family extracellular repeat protein